MTLAELLARFAEALEPVYQEAQRSGMSPEDFQTALGIIGMAMLKGSQGEARPIWDEKGSDRIRSGRFREELTEIETRAK